MTTTDEEAAATTSTTTTEMTEPSSSASSHPRIVDGTFTGWNACSLEVLRPRPRTRTPGARNVHGDETAERVPDDVEEEDDEAEGVEGRYGEVPLVIGCYELLERRGDHHEEEEEVTHPPPSSPSSSTGRVDEHDDAEDEQGAEEEDGERTETVDRNQGTRRGRLRLYLIDPTSPNGASFEASGRCPVAVTEMEGGVLDGKWMPMPMPSTVSRSVVSTRRKEGGSHRRRWYEGAIFASACSTGRVHLHRLVRDELGGRALLVPVTASSSSSPNSVEDNESSSAICLSLDWDFAAADHDGGGGDDVEAEGTSPAPAAAARIVSSYSNGKLAIHEVDVTRLASYSSEEESSRTSTGLGGEVDGRNDDDAVIREVLRWDAHSAYGVPSEVWTCCWAGPRDGNRNLVLSGADDCKLKGWDLRSPPPSSPIFSVGSEEHDAGVTAVSSHPTHEHLFASGCYDGVVRLWDVRRLSSSSSSSVGGRGGGPRGGGPLVRSEPCGGGIWRVRWHPHDRDVMLIGAMHGGCHVLRVDELNSLAPSSSSSTEEEGGGVGPSSDGGEGDVAGRKLEVISSFTAHESMAYGADWLHCPEPTSRAVVRAARSVPRSVDGDLAASCSFYDRRAFLWRAC